MAIASRFLAVALIVFLVLIVGGVALQIFLSRRKSKWLGLILPLLTFLYALALTLNVTSIDGAFPWGGAPGYLPAGEHPHAGAAGHLLGGPGEVPGAGPDRQNEH